MARAAAANLSLAATRPSSCQSEWPTRRRLPGGCVMRWAAEHTSVPAATLSAADDVKKYELECAAAGRARDDAEPARDAASIASEVHNAVPPLVATTTSTRVPSLARLVAMFPATPSIVIELPGANDVAITFK